MINKLTMTEKTILIRYMIEKDEIVFEEMLQKLDHPICELVDNKIIIKGI